MGCKNNKQCHVTLFVLIWHVELDSIIILIFATTMRLISAAKHSSVLSLLEQGYSYHQIHNKTSISLGTISKIGKELDFNKENDPGGHPSKLSAHDKQSIIWQINSRRLDNAVQAANFINFTLTHSVHPQIVRNALKEAGFHSATKKKVPMLKLAHSQRQLKFARYHKNWTVEDWKRVLWSDKTTLGQMARYMSGNNKGNHHQITLQHLLLNMEGKTILWCGVVWGGMGLESFWRFRERWRLSSIVKFWRMGWRKVGDEGGGTLLSTG